ncbi:MAG: GntR family transcriptional regulator [Actinomycetota bacterium]
MWSSDSLPEAPSRHEQVVRLLRESIAAGEFAQGDRLPTVRALSESLGLAVNTVARAYREAERAGVIETRGRSGSFVSSPDASHALKEQASAYAARARDLGFSPADALRAVEEAWSNLPR